MKDKTTRALEIGLEYAQECLYWHDAKKGRKHSSFALEAQQIEEDIQDIKDAIADHENKTTV